MRAPILFASLLWAVSAPAEGCAVLVVGDSLSAAYGMPAERGWVSLLGHRLAAQGYGCRLVNASVSGDTSRGGLARLPRALRTHEPSVVVIELGGNDGLRGLPLVELQANLQAMVRASLDAGARVLLTGIRIPPNYGPAYAEKFHQVYHELAREHGVALVPHLLEDVAHRPRLMQEDAIHPNVEAQPLIMEQVWERLEPLLVERGE